MSLEDDAGIGGERQAREKRAFKKAATACLVHPRNDTV